MNPKDIQAPSINPKMYMSAGAPYSLVPKNAVRTIVYATWINKVVIAKTNHARGYIRGYVMQ